MSRELNEQPESEHECPGCGLHFNGRGTLSHHAERCPKALLLPDPQPEADADEETFVDRKEESKQRRAGNRENSAKILSDNGISFESKNIGAHLIVKGRSITVDFWPGTGKWIVRGGKTGRGVFNLLKLEGLKPETCDRCGGWGWIDGDDQQGDCPECRP